MSLQISPVLAGTYDAPTYTAANNLASTQADSTNAIDSRRYTKFDHSATDAGTATNFSFSDFIDMINPLQHIPVVSSVYREVTGDTINPVSRVVGDILYGGAIGVASAIVGGVGAAGDAVVEAQTGKDSAGNVVASLFGSDQPGSPAATTQLAQADNATAAATPAAGAAIQTSTQTPSLVQTAAQTNARAKLKAAAVVAATSASVAALMPSSGVSSPAAQMASASSSAGSGMLGSLAGLTGSPTAGSSPLNGLNATNNFVLDPKKLPYGGVMAPPLQGNNMAMALANSAPGGVQMNHTVYTSRLTKGTKPSAVATASAAPPATPPATTPSGASATGEPPAYVSTSAPDALPSALISDIAALRAINQYRSTASQNSSTGASVDVVN